ncbi:MAG: CFI-box-CTERM domain-containing protein [Myxococcota bacterium]
MQMNSGFHWPYGRREGVLPVWAHRRQNAEGNEPFRRVIFQDRSSEGFASRTSNDASPDDYFCLSFNNDASSRDALDAVTCPSQFNSDKGRYLQDEDVAGGYAEPYEDEGGAAPDMRAMNTGSLYPPRRDLRELRGADHPDTQRFNEDARAVMPEIDAVTMATLPGNQMRTLQMALPEGVEPGEYIVYVEVNVEGDYAPSWDATRFPTPSGPMWDIWAETFGYPYRGQPSVVYAVPIVVSDGGGTFATSTPAGYGDIHGQSGELSAMDGTIADDADGAPGSGADRLMNVGGDRLTVRLLASNVCNGVDAPPSCFATCGADALCADGLTCSSTGECVGVCDEQLAVPAPANFTVELDEERSWQYAHIAFDAPDAPRPLTSYRVRVATRPYEEGEDFAAWGTEAKIASLEDIALVVPTDGLAGERVEASLGHLTQQSRYYIGLQAVDSCFGASPVIVQEIETTEIIFTTVSPCFVATAAYGSPMADDIGVLRRFRDRHLLTNALGRALVETYYEYGPDLAAFVAEDDARRSAARTFLRPFVALAEWLQE